MTDNSLGSIPAAPIVRAMAVNSQGGEAFLCVSLQPKKASATIATMV